MSEKQFDTIIFGATSFVGAILCRYLSEQYGVGGDVKWAAAGRNEKKLRDLRQSLGPAAKQLELIVADASSDADMGALCARGRVIVSTVGPYALYGEPLVRACAQSGTDYVDLTGESPWVREMMDKYGAAAERSGARIVPSCGFDSIPSDLGVWYLQQQARRKFDRCCSRVSMRVKDFRGGISGGTAASLLHMVEQASADARLREELKDPYSLCPPGTRRVPGQKSILGARKDERTGGWVAPFVMAPVNERVVLRSNALLGYAEDFTYDEAIMTGRGAMGALAAGALTAGMGAFAAGAMLAPTRRAIEKFVLPAPGEGPSPATQLNGRYDLRFYGETADGRKIGVKVTGDRDPGYGSTAKMLAEAGICLARDISHEQTGGGFWTTATAFGGALIERLQKNAGLSFSLAS